MVLGLWLLSGDSLDSCPLSYCGNRCYIKFSIIICRTFLAGEGLFTVVLQDHAPVILTRNLRCVHEGLRGYRRIDWSSLLTRAYLLLVGLSNVIIITVGGQGATRRLRQIAPLLLAGSDRLLCWLLLFALVWVPLLRVDIAWRQLRLVKLYTLFLYRLEEAFAWWWSTRLGLGLLISDDWDSHWGCTHTQVWRLGPDLKALLNLLLC